ncbi:MAG: glycosyltransferase family 2 protein [Psychroflexus sp.]|nr:glycosyltransferase family 2 protein [Psychroflexus sp.]
MNPLFSVVVTLYNEEENISRLIQEVSNALKDFSYKLIFVDDGSTDKTIAEIKKNAHSDVTLIQLTKNYGQTTAMAAGIDCSTGDYIVTMDGDLQNDPHDIPMMYKALIDNQVDVVAGCRHKRQDFYLRKLFSRIAGKLIRSLSGVYVRDFGCTLKVFKQKTAKQLDLYGDMHRFIPILAHFKGAKILDIDVNHHPRVKGESKYGFGRTFKVLSDLILLIFFKKYLRRPIHLFAPLGIISLLIGGFINSYLLFLKILGEDIWGKPILILGVTLLLAGIQFITFGIIAELIMRIYYNANNQKTFEIKKIYEFSETNKVLP